MPKPSKILKRGLYEAMWGAKSRDYGKYVGIKKKKWIQVSSVKKKLKN